MEESGGPMRRYGVAAHERVADGRRSVRRSWRRNGGGRGHGWRVRKSSAVVRTATGETRVWGTAWALAQALRKTDGGNTTLRRMGAAAGNLRSASRGSAGAQTAICFEQAQHQAQRAWQSARQARDRLRAILRADIVRRTFATLLLYSCT
jgi:hypothetical protein